MCAICGIVNLNGEPINAMLLERMTNILSHRGPDSKGSYIDKNIGLGHRRLKIIDLSERAHQPISNEDNSIFITYNGEVYNFIELRQELIQKGHIFKSDSDTEVVLHSYEEWGVDCLSHFIGMWAFIIWDNTRKRLFAARDRVGIKPLYYFYDTNKLVFASEIKAILECNDVPRYADVQSIYEYMLLGYSLGEATWFKNIRKLKPGHYLLLEGRDLVIRKYWQAESKPEYSLDEKKVASDIRRLVENSIQLMLRSDVEIGAHLSGGVDSSCVVAVASRLSPSKLRTFSGIFLEGKAFNESNFIDEVINNININNDKIIISPDNFIDTMDKIVWHLDEPIAGPGVYPQFFVSQFINQCGIKVILGGQGGDELFCGYPHYYSGILNSIFKSLAFDKERNYRKYYSDKRFYLKVIWSSMRRYIARLLSLRNKNIIGLFDKDMLNQLNFEKTLQNTGFYKGSLEEMCVWDIENYLPALLQVEDRVGMAFSIETRLPLLDHRLVEYAFKLPFYLKINSNNFKYILRKSMEGIVPESVLERRDKKGFPVPLRIWNRDKKFVSYCRDIESCCDGILRKSHEFIWERLNIGLWMRKFKIIL